MFEFDTYAPEVLNDDLPLSGKITFEINGLGGEIISSVDWEEDAAREFGIPPSFKVSFVPEVLNSFLHASLISSND